MIVELEQQRVKGGLCKWLVDSKDIEILLRIDITQLDPKKSFREQVLIDPPSTVEGKKEKLKRFGYKDEHIQKLVEAGVL